MNASDKNSLKIVVVGDGEVGKTCMCIVYSTGKFPDGYIPTVFDNHVVPTLVDDKTITVTLFDTAGQEAYDRLRPLSYTNSDVILVCFSVLSRNSFVNVERKWIPEVKHYCPNARLFIVGTKVDLRNKETSLKFEDGRQLAERVQAVAYFECSSITKTGLKEIFDSSIKSVLYETKEKKEKCSLM